ncbi:MAG: GatB/YqeY domain-containing protein [Rudaea sp.]
MTLKIRLTDDMKTAMKSGDKERLGTIRLVNAAIKHREVDERILLDDAQVLSVLEKMLKQRRDSIQQFEAASRTDLADKEKFEVGVIQGYMPAQLSAAEVDAAIAAAIAESGATSAKDMGKVMGLVKAKVAGRTDLADKEKFEIGVIQGYMPAQLSAAEVDAAITAAIGESGATSAKDMGKVMGLVKAKVAGRTDMGKLSELVKARLAALG